MPVRQCKNLPVITVQNVCLNAGLVSMLIRRKVFNAYKRLFLIMGTHLKNSIRFPSSLRSHTSEKPPAFIVPIIETVDTPSNISTVCKVSVHTTAFNPP